MSVRQINTANYDYAMMLEVINKSYKGKADITISEYDTTAAPSVQIGSVWEDNGAIFILETDDMTPTGYAGISSSTTFYLYYDESAEVFIYSETAPTWSDALQGWYNGNGNDRAFFSMYKDSGDMLYEGKSKLEQENTIRPVVDYGNIGTIIIAASTDWSISTQYLPNTTVTGASLYRSGYVGNSGSINARANGGTVSTDDYVTLSLTGTWRLLTRVYRFSESATYPVGLLQRIS